MSYEVYWRNRTRFLLSQFYFLALENDAEAVELERATDEINRALAKDPHAVGESRDDSERVLIVDPLTVRYEVFDATRVVIIYRMVYHRFPNRPG